jgi:thiol-disulfide isomerase/thioredoxin
MLKTRDDLKKYLTICKCSTIILKFTADWCGPCKQIAPVIDALNKQYETYDYEYIEININQSIDLYAFFKKMKMVNGVPSLLSFKKCEKTSDDFWVPFESTTGANIQNITYFYKKSLE